MPGEAWKKSLKNPKQYEALIKEGYSKEEAARISNAGGKKKSSAKKKK